MTFCCAHCKAMKSSDQYRVDLRRGELARDTRCDDCRKIASICRNFAISRDEYLRLMQAAGGKCQVCRSRLTTAKGGKLTIDHDHTTGQIRGVLCHSCNCALHAFISPRALAMARRYLVESQFKNSRKPITLADKQRLYNFAAMAESKRKFAQKAKQ